MIRKKAPHPSGVSTRPNVEALSTTYLLKPITDESLTPPTQRGISFSGSLYAEETENP